MFGALNNELWDAYDRKKQRFNEAGQSQQVWNERRRTMKKMKDAYTLRDISTILGVGMGTVRGWYYHHTFFPKKESFKDIFGQVRVTKKGYKTAMKRLKLAREKGFKRYKRRKRK